ncbi:endonuclease/exonuclease/phosphatase family protein [Salinisphaera orenii]|uniref:Endonuclease n=1 Tax=Salinisphaera orenii YIM 95161 TaxID=1051139 RepID=A0A423PK52_9GAMM|nr:endonuclease/exonuclease/phosphatase family protein [Salinisphaera halophila]ROO25974.1 endonuclease [Salinisphaera halophila YIM 95161]
MRLLLFILVVLAGLTLCGASLLPLIDSDRWWVRFADFPRLQLAILLGALVLVSTAFLRRYPKAAASLIVAMLIVIVHHAVVLWPYRPTGSRMAQQNCPTEGRLSVMVANVQLSNNPNGRLLEQVRRAQPDVLLILEANDDWTEALAPLAETMPHRRIHTTGSYFGIALYSRLPLVSPEVRYLAGQNTPQIVTGLELRTGEVVDFLGVHPRPPHPSQSALGRDAVLLKAGLLLRDADRPGVIAGDLNATPWERAVGEMQRLARLVDPRAGYGYLPTYDANSWWMAWPLDHVFYEPGFAVAQLERGARFGSDHYPYIARLCRVEPGRSAPPGTADPKLVEQARSVIQRARRQADKQRADDGAG